jgi:hypothetical protein
MDKHLNTIFLTLFRTTAMKTSKYLLRFIPVIVSLNSAVWNDPIVLVPRLLRGEQQQLYLVTQSISKVDLSTCEKDTITLRTHGGRQVAVPRRSSLGIVQASTLLKDSPCTSLRTITVYMCARVRECDSR